MEYGGLAFAFGVYRENMDDVSGAVYTPDARNPNHAVLLVGWDDAYPKEKFKTPPQNDGAWKVQNSWGTGRGEEGYYWISYEDKTIFGNEYALPAAFEMVPAIPDEKIYFHDPLGMNRIQEIGDESATVANAFIAKRDEKIVTVSFATAEDNLDYEVRIYRNIPAGEAPGAGVLSGSVARRTVENGGGYVTVDLNAPVAVGKGERFAVAVKFINTQGELATTLVPIEDKSVPGYGKAVHQEEESYFLEDGTWYDVNLNKNMQMGSFCVKALTVPTNDMGVPGDDGGSGNNSGGSGCDAGVSSLICLALVVLFFKKTRV
jgi:hypothetical protein